MIQNIISTILLSTSGVPAISLIGAASYVGGEQVRLIFSSVWLLIGLISIVSLWKIFTKASQPGWACLIPIYNLVVLFRIVGRPIWWILLFFIPVVNLVVSITLVNDLAKVFNKSAFFTLGLLFLPFIFYPILAFGPAQITVYS